MSPVIRAALALALLAACDGQIHEAPGLPEALKTPPAASEPVPGLDPVADPDPWSAPDPGSAPDPVPGSDPDPVPGTDPDPDPPLDPEPESPLASCSDTVVTQARVRRLTRPEIDASLRAIFGPGVIEEDLAQQLLVQEEEAHGFTTIARVGRVSPLFAEQLATLAEEVAARVLDDLDGQLPCSPASDGESACAHAFIAQVAPRFYRRALGPEELDALEGLYAAGDDFEDGVALVVEGLVQSSGFLYRTELGVDPSADILTLEGAEIASAISYLVIGGPPDDALMALAEEGALTDPDVREAQALRLLEAPEAADHLARFVGEWLGLHELESAGKSPEVYPDFSESLRAAMLEETRYFVAHSLSVGDPRMSAMLTSDTTFANAELAEHYGVSAASGDALEEVALPAERRGLLTQASLLATHANGNASSPVRRGLFVRERMFCQELPSPPQNLMVTVPPPDPSMTTRERFKQHSEDPQCSGCHVLMDPIGFGLEGYDGIGAFRTTENGKPIDDSGELKGTDVDGPFAGGPELGAKLAASDLVMQCVALQYFRYSMGRGELEGAAKTCAIDDLAAGFIAGDTDLRELVVGLVRSDELVTRRAMSTEVTLTEPAEGQE